MDVSVLASWLSVSIGNYKTLYFVRELVGQFCLVDKCENENQLMNKFSPKTA